MSNKIKKISDIIVSSIQLSQLFEKKQVLDVYNSWSYIVGEKIASHSRLIDIKNNSAIIETDHNGWAQQILYKKKEILKKFKTKYNQLEIKNISVIVSSKYKENKSFVESKKFFNIDKNNVNYPINNSNKNFPLELLESFERLKKSIIEHS